MMNIRNILIRLMLLIFVLSAISYFFPAWDEWMDGLFFFILGYTGATIEWFWRQRRQPSSGDPRG